MLKNKKHNTHEEWLSAYRHAQLERDVERSERLIEKAIARIPKGKSFFGWSGGKDAIALQVICERAGIYDCVIGTIGERWEYPAFWSYVKQNHPEGLVVKDKGITTDFMNDHEEMIFPLTSNTLYRWYVMCQQSAVYSFADENQADNIILGHRKLDGNNLSPKRGKVYPIFDFTHEDVFCIIACNDLKLAPTYDYLNGFYTGTGAWIMTAGKNAADEVYHNDKSVLYANRSVRKIDEYLKRKENGA